MANALNNKFTKKLTKNGNLTRKKNNNMHNKNMISTKSMHYNMSRNPALASHNIRSPHNILNVTPQTVIKFLPIKPQQSNNLFAQYSYNNNKT